MKSLHRNILPILLCSLIAPATLTHAATYYWGGGVANIGGTATPAGGNGTWNTTIQNWTLNTYSGSGNPYVAFTNLASDNAVFGGTAGTVLVGADLTTGDLGIATSNYIFQLSANRTLTTTSFSGAGLASSIFRPSSGNLTLGLAGAGDFSGTLANNGANVLALTKTGTGTLTLSGNNTYTGITTFSGGIVRLNSANALSGGIGGNGTSRLTLNGGAILGLGNGDFTRGLGTTATTAQLTSGSSGDGAGFAAYGADRFVNMGGSGVTLQFGTTNFFATATSALILGAADSTHTLDFQNGLDLNGGSRIVRVNDGAAAVDGKITGIISNTTGTGNFTKTGAGTLELTRNNTYNGTTTVSAGTLLVSAGNMNSTSGITVDGSSTIYRYDSSTASTRNVSVTGGATFAYNSAGNYSGTFSQTNGKLGGTNWNGTLGGLTIGVNQTIAPGNSVGTASTTSQTWASLGSFDWEINKGDGTAGLTAGGWDLLNLSSTLTISSTSGSRFTINILSLGLDNLPGLATGFNSGTSYNWLFADSANAISGFAANKFTLITSGFSNTFNGTFGIALGDTISGGDNTQLYITYTAVPEPATFALLAASLTVLMIFRRRRA